MDDSLDCDSMSNAGNTDRDFVIPNIVEDNQPSKTETTVLAVDTKINEDAHTINNDAKDHLVTERMRNGYTQNVQ